MLSVCIRKKRILSNTASNLDVNMFLIANWVRSAVLVFPLSLTVACIIIFIPFILHNVNLRIKILSYKCSVHIQHLFILLLPFIHKLFQEMRMHIALPSRCVDTVSTRVYTHQIGLLEFIGSFSSDSDTVHSK